MNISKVTNIGKQMNNYISKVVGVSSVLMGFTTYSATAENKKPNILLIMADDLGYNDLGVQGSPEMVTPNIDSIANNGVRFTDAYVTDSVCSPSRAGMLTGRYQQRFGHEANCPPIDLGMNLQELTLGNLLQDQGYRTGIFGKWHLGDKDEYHPNNRGFDTFVGFREGSCNYWPIKNQKKGDPHNIERNKDEIKWTGYLTDLIGNECEKFISQESEKPFFAFLSYNAPHAPMQAKPKDLLRFKDSPRPTLHAMIYAMDESIGKVIAGLKKSGKYKNTIIYFLSDNGGTTVNSSCNWPLKGYKGNRFEGGNRVPFFVQWEGVIKKGQVCNGLVSSLDIAATSLIMAGGQFPKVRPLDGVDLMPYMIGKKSGNPHETLYWRREQDAAVRHGDWKFIYIKSHGSALYNLKDDVREKKNILKSHPELAQTMKTKLLNWEKGLVKPWWSDGKYWVKENSKINMEYIENRNHSMDKVEKKLGLK